MFRTKIKEGIKLFTRLKKQLFNIQNIDIKFLNRFSSQTTCYRYCLLVNRFDSKSSQVTNRSITQWFFDFRPGLLSLNQNLSALDVQDSIILNNKIYVKDVEFIIVVAGGRFLYCTSQTLNSRSDITYQTAIQNRLAGSRKQ